MSQAITSVHNIAVIGRDGTGKSKLVDAWLHLIAQTPESLIAELPEEESRGITIYNRFYSLAFDQGRINLIDTPGNSNFLPKVGAALSVASGAVLVIAGSGSAESSLRLFETMEAANRPKVIFVNMLDLPDTNWENSVHELELQFNLSPLVLFLPIYQDGQLVGLVDVLSGEPIGGGDLSEGLKEERDRYFQAAIEQLSELDDELMADYLEGRPLDPELINQVLTEGIRTKKLTPLLLGAASKGVGVKQLSLFIAQHFPTHSQNPIWVGMESGGQDAGLVERRPVASEAFSAMVFKTLHDRFSGKLNFALVVSGLLVKGQKVLNSSTGAKIDLNHFARMNGDHTEPIEEAGPGDIIVIEKESHLFANQTLCDPSEPILFEPIAYPVPRCTYHLELTDTSQDNRIIDSLHKVMEEDPSLRLHKNIETGEILLSGMGPLHLEVVREHLKSVYAVEIKLVDPYIAYHETITKSVKVHGRHKKQSGGHGQFGDVYLLLEPLPRGEGVLFESKIVGGVIPKQYIGSVEKGVREALIKGSLGGYLVSDIKVTLVDGSHHSVDSSDQAFVQAGILAIRQGLPDAAPILLEPIMEMEIDLPEADLGRVTKDINARRGRVTGYTYREFTTLIKAECPLAELSDYAVALKNMTQDKGLFSMHLKGHEAVTSHLSKKILAQAQR